ncbi:hypothetical protein SNE40_009963 [Patella caerulea]|uniref:Mutator-like transposase domain-containing protein n=1 Tax=Patella caerulea TaxID=87958 RepID=A0AAN8Q3Y2_PATCE
MHLCKKNRSSSEKEFDAWFVTHNSKQECNINFNGTSNAMEVEAATVLWKRSMESGFRNKILFSDEYSKSFDKLTKLNIYGDGHIIEKHDECVNHVPNPNYHLNQKKCGVIFGVRVPEGSHRAQ